MSPNLLVRAAVYWITKDRLRNSLSSATACFAHVVAQIVAASLIATPIFASNPTFGHNFDGTALAWQLVHGRTDVRILAHEQWSEGFRKSSGCERLIVAAPGGESALISCPIPRVAVLDELAVKLRVKASRPDVQLAVRVVMPRSLDSQGVAMTALVRGSTYFRPGQWQQLSLANAPKLLAAEVRVMRSGTTNKIDPREAYIGAILLIVPGEPNGVELFTDDLEVDGVALQEDEIHLANFEAPPALTSQTASPTASLASVELEGSLLLVDGKPFLPRTIEWQGEPLEFLAQLGFNSVQLPAPPTADQIAEATRLALWFVCAAPKPDAIAERGLGQTGDRVLAWLLDDRLVESAPAYGRNWAELICQHDAVSGRPIITAPEVEWQTGSNAGDILLTSPPRLGGMSAADCDEWLASRASLGRPGIPLWVCIPTQYGHQVQQQSAALVGELAAQQQVDADIIEMLVRTACTRATRGVLFSSISPLDEENPQTRLRAAMMQLTNRYLQIVEPWLAGGKVIGRIESTDSAWTGVLLHVDRARLLIPIRAQASSWDPSARNSAGSSQRADIPFVIPGVPESTQVFLISPVAFRPLPVRRIAGGTRVVFPQGADHMLLITEDPQVVQTFRHRIAHDAPQVSRLRRTLIEQRAAVVAETGRRLTQLGHDDSAASRELSLANAELQQCDSLISSGQFERASQLMDSASDALWSAADDQRQLLNDSQPIASNPLALSYGGLVDLAKFRKSSVTFRGGENLLYGGDFEDLGQMTEFGWQHLSHPMLGVHGTAKLSTNQPKHGTYCLELLTGSASTKDGPISISGAPVWIVSPPIAVEKDQVIEITGWVRVDKPIVGSVDGLQIVDTLGGPELAVPVRQTSGWQPLRIIRGVPSSTELRITFALTGLGSASIDGVMVRALHQPIAKRLPLVAPTFDATSTDTADNSGLLFVAPTAR